jgi:pimeloyl-ACP methyl ester carboxylesterase
LIRRTKMDTTSPLNREDDRLSAFLQSPFDEQIRLVLHSEFLAGLERELGADVAREVHALAARTSPALTEHLGDGIGTNLIFVPGVMGSVLTSRGLGGTWWIDVRNLRRVDALRLTPDGDRDAEDAARIEAAAVDISYFAFLSAVARQDGLRHDTFAYDWRKSPRLSGPSLARAVVRAFETNGGKPVHLVAHSMGGLIVRTALMQHPEIWSKLGRIVFLGTPHYGAPAIAGYLKNHLWGFELLALLGSLLSRQTFRSLRGVLALLPAPTGVYPATRSNRASVGEHPCANYNLYDADAWQLGLNQSEIRELQVALDASAELHRDLHRCHYALDQALRDRMCVIAGVGFRTLFRLEHTSPLGLWDTTRKVVKRERKNPHREGDGRVPLASAALEGVGDIRYVRCGHSSLPSAPGVYRDVFRWLERAPLALPKTPEAALDVHLADDETVSESPALDAYHTSPLDEEDPGVLDMRPVLPERLIELEQLVVSGRLPEFLRVKLL